MNALWDHYWPAITAALVIGAIAGTFAFRRPIRRGRSNAWLAIGTALAVAAAASWHGPLGASHSFATSVDRQTRQLLADFEMGQVTARLERDPLRRTIRLSGPADDFQRNELVRILDDVPGVGNVHWADNPAPFAWPLWSEAALACLGGFGLGLILSYVVELRRRSQAQWRW